MLLYRTTCAHCTAPLEAHRAYPPHGGPVWVIPTACPVCDTHLTPSERHTLTVAANAALDAGKLVGTP